jgi:hypothetical protein
MPLFPEEMPPFPLLHEKLSALIIQLHCANRQIETVNPATYRQPEANFLVVMEMTRDDRRSYQSKSLFLLGAVSRATL